jgi:hypothetical protein
MVSVSLGELVRERIGLAVGLGVVLIVAPGLRLRVCVGVWLAVSHGEPLRVGIGLARCASGVGAAFAGIQSGAAKSIKKASAKSES